MRGKNSEGKKGKYITLMRREETRVRKIGKSGIVREKMCESRVEMFIGRKIYFWLSGKFLVEGKKDN